jgi:hypothetical protein
MTVMGGSVKQWGGRQVAVLTDAASYGDLVSAAFAEVMGQPVQ